MTYVLILVFFGYHEVSTANQHDYASLEACENALAKVQEIVDEKSYVSSNFRGVCVQK